METLYQPFPMASAARGQVRRHAPRYWRPRHFHLEPELNLVVAGSGSFGVGDAVLATGAGDLLWWAPGQDHELVSCSDDFDLFVIGITPELSDRVLGCSSSPLGGPTRLRLMPEDLERFRAACAAAPQDRTGAEQHVGDLWRAAHRLRMSSPDKHGLTRRALLLLTGDPELQRSEVALRVRSHPSEVSRRFHHDVHLTLTTYRTRLRLLRFIEAVDRGAKNLLYASLEAGFGSYSQCHRAFWWTLGCTPRSFFGSGVRQEMGDACKESAAAASMAGETPAIYYADPHEACLAVLAGIGTKQPQRPSRRRPR